jgi:hypothetical protein
MFFMQEEPIATKNTRRHQGRSNGVGRVGTGENRVNGEKVKATRVGMLAEILVAGIFFKKRLRRKRLKWSA